MQKRYTHHARSVTRLRYHIILVSKYRYPLTQEISGDRVKSSIDHAVSRCSGVRLLSCGFDKDHIHIIIDSPPKWSPSQLVSRIKQLSTHYLWEHHESDLRRIYWRKKVIWTNGFFCESIGNVDEDKVLNYVKNQGK